MKDHNFLMVSLSHSLAITYFYAYTTVLEQMITPFGFNGPQASYLSASFQFAGIVGGVVCSVILAKTGPKAFKVTSIVLLSFTALSKSHQQYKIILALVCVHLSIMSSSFPLLMCVSCVNGFINLA